MIFAKDKVAFPVNSKESLTVNNPQLINDQLERALLTINRIEANKVIQKAFTENGPIETVEQLITPVLERIGRAWEVGEIALSQYYMSGRICEEVISTLFPVSSNLSISFPQVAITTLEDHHLLGKQIVYSILHSSGFAIIDYGITMVSELVERSIKDKIKLLLISVLMLPSAMRVREVKEGLLKAGAEVLIAVGGAPFRLDPLLWQEVGADLWGKTASDAIAIVRKYTS